MKPIVVSACLAGEFCRYDGGATPCPEVIKLVKAGLALPLCPELLGGLEAPRSPCERQGDSVLGKDGQDYTAAFQRGAEQALRLAQEAGCTVGILKERSPSCGVHQVYDGSFTGCIVSGRGLWAERLVQSGFRVYDESALASCGTLSEANAIADYLLGNVVDPLPNPPSSEVCVRGVWTWSEHPLCDEHFVDAPRVPGTLILAMFEERIREHFSHVRVMGVRRFRFVHFVEPATYTYELTVEHGVGQVHCTLWSGERRVAEGSILIAYPVDVR